MKMYFFSGYIQRLICKVVSSKVMNVKRKQNPDFYNTKAVGLHLWLLRSKQNSGSYFWNVMKKENKP